MYTSNSDDKNKITVKTFEYKENNNRFIDLEKIEEPDEESEEKEEKEDNEFENVWVDKELLDLKIKLYKEEGETVKHLIIEHEYDSKPIKIRYKIKAEGDEKENWVFSSNLKIDGSNRSVNIQVLGSIYKFVIIKEYTISFVRSKDGKISEFDVNLIGCKFV